jgi:hypothetical protein
MAFFVAKPTAASNVDTFITALVEEDDSLQASAKRLKGNIEQQLRAVVSDSELLSSSCSFLAFTCALPVYYLYCTGSRAVTVEARRGGPDRGSEIEGGGGGTSSLPGRDREIEAG